MRVPRHSPVLFLLAAVAVAAIVSTVLGGDAAAQATPLILDKADGPSGWSLFWDEIRRRPYVVVPAIGLVANLIKGKDDAWTFLLVSLIGALLFAIVLFEMAPELVKGARPSVAEAIVTTVVLAILAGLLFLLHLKRPGFFATTEIAFGLAGIYFSVRLIGENNGMWAALAVSIFGVVEGIDRLVTSLTAERPRPRPRRQARP